MGFYTHSVQKTLTTGSYIYHFRIGRPFKELTVTTDKEMTILCNNINGGESIAVNGQYTWNVDMSGNGILTVYVTVASGSTGGKILIEAY